MHMVKAHFVLENLRILGEFLGRSILEKFQYSSAVPNINIVVQYYFSVKCILVIFVCFKIYFFISHHWKSPRIRQKLLGVFCVITTRKRSLRQGNIFTRICHSFCPWGRLAMHHASEVT